jgi:hypothetical protein
MGVEERLVPHLLEGGQAQEGVGAVGSVRARVSRRPGIAGKGGKRDLDAWAPVDDPVWMGPGSRLPWFRAAQGCGLIPFRLGIVRAWFRAPWGCAAWRQIVGIAMGIPKRLNPRPSLGSGN